MEARHTDANELVTRPTQPVRRPVLVWDAPVRLFHWLVVVLVTAAYVTLKLNWIDWHVRVGETLLALVISRLLWAGLAVRPRAFAVSWRRPRRRCQVIGPVT
jgi:cytochrome b